ncbi:GbsR/MarR family transcriptional regulator [Terrabacter sp. Ter38]|uniref:GbsR/MarR family transcriptional regulator n=1 Tax=Terrabacter sp. Ter38 TaxID=2926030 RepID=UPI00211946F5|nr:MarR family transcriptional regulator [Terrabacter sp. Ter38]
MTSVRQRSNRDERGVSAYVERLGDTLTDAGMPRLAARVFARLLADDDGRMTAAELTESLDVSPAAVSGAVRYLTQTYLIGKERERGSRRDVYVVQADAWHGAMLSRDRMLAQIESGLRAGVPAVGGLGTEAGRRLQLSVAFLEFLGDRLAELEGEWAARKAEITRTWPTDTP